MSISTVRSGPQALRRLFHPEVRMVDRESGIVDYTASDETIDAYREIVRADGWRFTHFAKNAPFVDSHDYTTILKQVGRVIDFGVRGKRLWNRVQWAIDVPENDLAQVGFRMTAAGYLKAVSVGFWPLNSVSRFDSDPAAWREQLDQLGLDDQANVNRIYTTQEQIELSACILGANPNALVQNAAREGVISSRQADAVLRIMSASDSQQPQAREFHFGRCTTLGF